MAERLTGCFWSGIFHVKELLLLSPLGNCMQPTDSPETTCGFSQGTVLPQAFLGLSAPSYLLLPVPGLGSRLSRELAPVSRLSWVSCVPLGIPAVPQSRPAALSLLPGISSGETSMRGHHSITATVHRDLSPPGARPEGPGGLLFSEGQKIAPSLPRSHTWAHQETPA